ncbi:hypothetical protein SCACP_40840 [Sporomusa carbonis]
MDEVSQVTKIADDAVEPPPEFGGGFDRKFITGLAKKKEVQTWKKK